MDRQLFIQHPPCVTQGDSSLTTEAISPKHLIPPTPTGLVGTRRPPHQLRDRNCDGSRSSHTEGSSLLSTERADTVWKGQCFST